MEVDSKSIHAVAVQQELLPPQLEDSNKLSSNAFDATTSELHVDKILDEKEFACKSLIKQLQYVTACAEKISQGESVLTQVNITRMHRVGDYIMLTLMLPFKSNLFSLEENDFFVTEFFHCLFVFFYFFHYKLLNAKLFIHPFFFFQFAFSRRVF